MLVPRSSLDLRNITEAWLKDSRLVRREGADVSDIKTGQVASVWSGGTTAAALELTSYLA